MSKYVCGFCYFVQSFFRLSMVTFSQQMDHYYNVATRTQRNVSNYGKRNEQNKVKTHSKLNRINFVRVQFYFEWVISRSDCSSRQLQKYFFIRSKVWAVVAFLSNLFRSCSCSFTMSLKMMIYKDQFEPFSSLLFCSLKWKNLCIE